MTSDQQILQIIPKHIAIIMDGNGRWAAKKKWVRVRGHLEGINAIRKTVNKCRQLGVSYLTLYAFSTENWKRPQKEINALWDILIKFLDKEVPDLKKNNIKLESIGHVESIPQKALNKLQWGKEQTQANNQMTLILAINYGSRSEIIHAIQEAIESNQFNQSNKITEDDFSKYLMTKNYPDPEILIRTSGEQRISNYLLWQISYSELFFIDTLWPDFNEEDLLTVLNAYQKRQRRFGGI